MKTVCGIGTWVTQGKPRREPGEEETGQADHMAQAPERPPRGFWGIAMRTDWWPCLAGPISPLAASLCSSVKRGCQQPLLPACGEEQEILVKHLAQGPVGARFLPSLPSLVSTCRDCGDLTLTKSPLSFPHLVSFPLQKSAHFTYCVETGMAVGTEKSGFAGWAFPFPGVAMIKDFVSADEEAQLVQFMNQDDWKLSQSGRRKQDYGPKVNFRKQKLKPGGFDGLPRFSREIVQRMGQHPVLERFLPVEQCNLDYHPDRGSAIDPHLDDSWLWGERLVSLNLLSPTVLSMSRDSNERLQLVSVARQGTSCSTPNDNTGSGRSVPCDQVEVAIHLPARSLLVLFGAARYQWKHAIHRQHIESHRICATFRELSAEFCPGGKHGELGQELLEIALSFQGKPV